MKVLIVEDYQPIANVLAALMHGIADRVIIAASLLDARTEMRKPNGFDVVFLDLQLPDSSVMTTIENVRWIHTTGRKVVLMTGHDLDLEALRASSGADACFYKFDPDFAGSVVAQLKSAKPATVGQ